MPRKPCYWTRALELELVKFVREREFIWRPAGNTNHQIKQKYKAYAEFAAKLGPGFTARSVRDRWVNIRSTYNHNARRVRRSLLAASGDVFTPCWPLWGAMQFLAHADQHQEGHKLHSGFKQLDNIQVKEELSDIDPTVDPNVKLLDYILPIRERGTRTDRPRKKPILVKTSNEKCKKVIEDLTAAMKPLVSVSTTQSHTEQQSYWFFGRHVTERLNCMRDLDAECASDKIMKILEEYKDSDS